MGQTRTEGPEMLLRPGDPEPALVINQNSACPIVLVCEHAGNAVPQALARLGLPDSRLKEHIAHDIGAEEVARRMAEQLGAPLILQPYSRLVVDCNRPIESPELMIVKSDSTPIPGNADISSLERLQRIEEIFIPFQRTVSRLLYQHKRKAVFAIHSFTPVLASRKRPWELSFLFRKDTRTSIALAEAIGTAEPEIRIGMNEPYDIDDMSDWFVPNHGERSGLAHSLIELRNDGIRTQEGCIRWSRLLAGAISSLFGGTN